MSDKMRKEFIEAFVKQFGFGRMAASSNTDAAGMLVCAEWAWFASRESMVIELPRDVDQFADDDPGRRAFSLHTNTAYRECRKAIESAGLKVKS